MKTTRRIATLLLALVMILSLATTAFAEDDTYTLTINGTNDKHTYEVYQIFAGDLNDKGVLSNIIWGNGVSEGGQTALGAADTVAKDLETAADAAAFAKSVASYLQNSTEVKVAEGFTSTSVSLAAGYYLIKDKDNSLNNTSESYSAYMLKVVAATSVTAKFANTTSEKEVYDKNDSDASKDAETWQDSADYDIGDDVPFQLKATITEKYDDYKVYKLTFHDTEDNGLTFNANSVKVYVNGNKITDGYTVNSDPNDGHTFDVVFSDLKQISSVKAGSVITVEYTSKLNKNAVVGNPGNKNKMHITFSNNPNDEQGGEIGQTPDDTVVVFTYKTIINKKDGKGKDLTGAEFTLEKILADGNKKTIDVVKSDDGFKFTFTGLDDGKYVLTETTTPSGFNTIDPIEFTVSAVHGTTITSLNGTPTEDGAISFNVDPAYSTLSADVVNNEGATLPSTGGMGTTLFYMVGGLMVVAAVILLVTKKRMSVAE